jgi:2-polyprenyl-3-methyl-5-hydroxy-6-metoxy-1,4-benzoquinol methylase
MGQIVYQNLHDRLFGAPGGWSFRQCPEPSCGLLWLDPMPRPEEVHKAYNRYYTHHASETGAQGLLKQTWHTLKAAYLAERFGYCDGSHGLQRRALAALMYVLPLRRRALEGFVRFLRHRPGGRLLDVGCGSGSWLVRMRELGWNVEGVDFDPSAIEVARNRDLNVRLGSLEAQGYDAETFDAVTLNHVIEHLPDPEATLRECHRALRSGGQLVVATPNVHSLSHRMFRTDWRGLEPPRHLHLFTVGSLRRVLEAAGFRRMTWHPQIAFSVVYESLLLRRGHTDAFTARRTFRSAQLLAKLFNLWELALIRVQPEWADCLMYVAWKNAEDTALS